MAFAKNTRTGKTTTVPDHYIGHPVLGKDLIAIDSKVEAAPKKEKKKKTEAIKVQELSWAEIAEEIEEQPAPETNLENEENEDGN
jgi:dTDP-4-dehydrorhamnose reductase